MRESLTKLPKTHDLDTLHKMAGRHEPSLSKLARMDNPFENDHITKVVKQKLLKEKQEGRHLEWKQMLPVGKDITIRTKYRTVKAIISFANTDGGFVICGVRDDGKWVGVSKERLSKVDSANITELVNGCISPEIIVSNYFEMEHKGKYYLVLHVPPSKSIPHVTTKPIYEQTDRGKRNILERYAVYCRYGAKSDLAKPSQFQRIIKKRTEYLEHELLRRIKDVPLSTHATIKASREISDATLHIGNIQDSSSAQILRTSHRREECDETLYYEELAEGVLDDVNKILDANKQLSRSDNKFVLKENVYYYIYSKREKVNSPNDQIKLLAQTGLKLYAPALYWLLQLSLRDAVEVIKEISENPKRPSIFNVMRLAVLLGPSAEKWLKAKLDKAWRENQFNSGRPSSFDEMRKLAKTGDRRLAALRNQSIYLPDEDKKTSIRTFLKTPQKALDDLLSKYCEGFSNGRKSNKAVCRPLDILVYGKAIQAIDYKIIKLLCN